MYRSPDPVKKNVVKPRFTIEQKIWISIKYLFVELLYTTGVTEIAYVIGQEKFVQSFEFGGPGPASRAAFSSVIISVEGPGTWSNPDSALGRFEDVIE